MFPEVMGAVLLSLRSVVLIACVLLMTPGCLSELLASLEQNGEASSQSSAAGAADGTEARQRRSGVSSNGTAPVDSSKPYTPEQAEAVRRCVQCLTDSV